jgi:hypothetical protein
MPLAQSRPEHKRLTVECLSFRPFEKNTLRGFADIFVKDLALTIKDVSLHTKGSSRWASLPAKPMIKDGAVMTDETTGKPHYIAILEFSSRAVSSAFSVAVIAAVLAHNPNAFGKPGGADPGF